jgi:hypothetical protein
VSEETQDWMRDGKPFGGEVDLEHEWATKYRLPLLRHWYPAWKYEIALVVPPVELWDHIEFTWPTDDEARFLAHVLAYRMDYYNERWRQKMQQRPLDVDSGSNTMIVAKIGDAWHYRLSTWRAGPQLWPAPLAVREGRAEPFVGLDGLRRLVDHHGRHGTWPRWIAEHPFKLTEVTS